MSQHLTTIRLLLIALVAMVSVSCAPTPDPAHITYLDHDIPFILPDPVWTQDKRTVLQQVTLSKGKHRHNFNAILELKPTEVKIALLDITGSRAFDINWTSDNLEITKSDKIPEQIDGSHILAQIVVAFWPVEQVKKGLPVNIELEQSNIGRTLKNKNETVMTIRTQGDNPWTSTSEINNRMQDVQFQISSQIAGRAK